jgi:hypothetical protein
MLNLLKHQKKFHIKVRLIFRQPMLIMDERDIVQAHFNKFSYVPDELTAPVGKVANVDAIASTFGFNAQII